VFISNSSNGLELIGAGTAGLMYEISRFNGDPGVQVVDSSPATRSGAQHSTVRRTSAAHIEGNTMGLLGCLTLTAKCSHEVCNCHVTTTGIIPDHENFLFSWAQRTKGGDS
jgi:hypothetical protein